MQFNGRYEKSSENRPRRDAANTRSLRESVNLYVDIPRYRWFWMHLLSRIPVLYIKKKKNSSGSRALTSFPK